MALSNGSTLLGAWGWGAGTKTFYTDAGWTIDTNHTLETASAKRHLNGDGNGSGYCLEVDTNAATITPNVGTTARWFHAYIVPKTPASPTTYVLHFMKSGGATFWVQVASTGTITLLRGTLFFSATTLATSASPINPNVGHWFAIKAFVDNSGYAEVFVDGASVVSYTGDTQGAATANWDQVALAHSGLGSGGISPEICVSDVIITDDASTPLPELYSTVLTVGGVDSGNLVGNPTTGANRYQNVDEGGGTVASKTEYNEGTVANDEDLYTVTDPSYTFTAVEFISIWGWAERAGALTSLQLSVKSGATTQYQTAVTLPATTWQAVPYYLDTDPDASADWDDTSLAAIKVGAKFT